VKLGLLGTPYLAVAKKALNAVMENIDEHGVVQNVSYGTPMGKDSKDFYKQIPIRPMPYGQALAMLFLMESQGMDAWS
jgi:unsaturated rhamnogalacturonyl hydrolase